VARRLIGLDIGTNAVRVAEVEPGNPTWVTTFGQVALPPEAMREGEVVDPGAVTAAIQRLWKELSLGRGEVRVGVASPRVLVRTVDLPAMAESDLASALRFQAQELIPIPLEEAVLDFQVLESVPGAAPTPAPEHTEPGGDEPPTEPGGTPPTEPEGAKRVLLAAAHRDTVDGLVGAVRAAGLRVGAVDLIPLALIRSIGTGVSDEGVGAEAIVSVGGGVTVIVIHEAGIPRFVRSLGVAGRSLTDAIARDLALTVDQAEALKRQGDRAPEDLARAAAAAMARPLGDLAEQVRGSLDYYRTQPDATTLLRVTLTGGGALSSGLPERLHDLVGLPVDFAAPRDHIAVADIGFPGDQIPSLDPFLPVPVGLALGGLATGKRINLVGGDGRGAVDRARVVKVAAVVGAVLVLGLGALWWVRKSAVDTEKERLAEVEQENERLQSKIASLSDAQQAQSQVEAIRAQVQTIVATDISWSRMLQEIARTIPADSWLTAFTGSSNAGAAVAAGTTAPTGTGPVTSGSATFTIVGLDFTSVSAWIQRISTIPSFADLWVPSATKGASTEAASSTSGSSSTTTSGGRVLVNYTSNATITSEAQSDRAEQFEEETP